MKIRSDFVTNSSSTSFVLIGADHPTRRQLADLLGISLDSPLAVLVDALVEALRRAVRPQEWHEDLRGEARRRPYSQWLEETFSAEAARRVLVAEAAGVPVVVGRLSTHEGDAASFLCQDAFSAEGRGLFLYAESCVI